MPKFRKKPLVVEAMQFDGTRVSFEEIFAWMDGENVDSPMLGYEGPDDDHPESFRVRTTAGQIRTMPGDWVIRDIKGEFYPIKPDMFALTHEPAESDAETEQLPGSMVDLGVIEFHDARKNSGLIERFYAVTTDLKDSGSIVDVWLMDIASVLREFGYDMRIYRMPKSIDPSPAVGPGAEGEGR